MLPIIMLNTNNKNYIHGTCIHMYELALYFKDLGLDVYFVSRSTEENMLDNYRIRYTKTLPIYTLDTLPKLSKYNLFHYMSYKEQPFIDLFLNATTTTCLITDGILEYIKRLKTLKTYDMINILKNTKFIYDKDLPNDVSNLKMCVEQLICSWGIYSKYLKIDDRSKNVYFIYARQIDNFSTNSVIDKAIAYCNNNNLEYVLDTKKCFDPWNEYAGLIYARNVDYSPRMPFEFGIANKPTICFDVSPGLKTLAQDTTLYKSIIMQTKKELYIPIEKIFV